jgi:hypothetical protein
MALHSLSNDPINHALAQPFTDQRFLLIMAEVLGGGGGYITVSFRPSVHGAIARPNFLVFLSLFGPKNLDVTVTYVPSVQFKGTHHASPEHLVEMIQYTDTVPQLEQPVYYV